MKFFKQLYFYRHYRIHDYYDDCASNLMKLQIGIGYHRYIDDKGDYFFGFTIEYYKPVNYNKEY